MIRTGLRTAILVLLLAAVGGCLLAEPVTWPRYTRDQLNDKAFIQAEIQKYQALRQELDGKLKGVNEMTAVPFKRDLGIVTSVLAALDYVAIHGYDPKDPGLAKLEYFTKQQYPVMPVKPKPAKPVEEKIYNFDDHAIKPPTPTANPPVDVPPELIGEGLSGVFQCEFVIDSQGVPKELKVLRSVNKEIDALATSTILDKWRFEPGTKDDKPVSVRHKVAIPFNLKPPAPAETAGGESGKKP